VTLTAKDFPWLQPRAVGEPQGAYGELDLWYLTDQGVGIGNCTGANPSTSICTEKVITGSFETPFTWCTATSGIGAAMVCTQQTTYKRYRALTKIDLEFGDVEVAFTSSVNENVAPVSLTTTDFAGLLPANPKYAWPTAVGAAVNEATLPAPLP
jgi:hypothetical protein